MVVSKKTHNSKLVKPEASVQNVSTFWAVTQSSHSTKINPKDFVHTVHTAVLYIQEVHIKITSDLKWEMTFLL